jgi:predicted flap endonuclease-1-like 5' DNA nuclease
MYEKTNRLPLAIGLWALVPFLQEGVSIPWWAWLLVFIIVFALVLALTRGGRRPTTGPDAGMAMRSTEDAVLSSEVKPATGVQVPPVPTGMPDRRDIPLEENMPELRNVPDMRDMPEIPPMRDVPVERDMPGLRDMPDLPDMPVEEEIQGLQDVPDWQDVPDPAGIADTREVPFTPPAPPPDDLTIIEGIGPRINEILHRRGVITFLQLSEMDMIELDRVLASENVGIADPASWAEQARLAANGDWEGLQRYQDQLKGGRRVV